MIVRTEHITTGLSGLSPFDEFMRIQVSNMETFKMESYFPGLRFTVIVDRYFCFYGCLFSKQQRIGTCFDYMRFLKGWNKYSFSAFLKDMKYLLYRYLSWRPGTIPSWIHLYQRSGILFMLGFEPKYIWKWIFLVYVSLNIWSWLQFYLHGLRLLSYDQIRFWILYISSHFKLWIGRLWL